MPPYHSNEFNTSHNRRSIKEPGWVGAIKRAYQQDAHHLNAQFNDMTQKSKKGSYILDFLCFEYNWSIKNIKKQHLSEAEEANLIKKKLDVFNKLYSAILIQFNHLSLEEKNIILSSRSSSGFCLLQQAIYSHQKEIINPVIDLLLMPAHQPALDFNLINFNQAGFGILQSAIKSGSEPIFFKVLELLQSHQALDKHLVNFTHDGFGVFQHAITSGSELIFFKILELLQGHPAIDEHLSRFTHDGFGVLQGAIKSGSESIFFRVLELLQNPEVLDKHLVNFTRDGFGVLQHAITSGSEPIFFKVLDLLENHHALNQHLFCFTRDDFGVLHDAIKSGSETIFLKVLGLLQPRHDLLNEHLFRFTRDGFGVLQQAIISGSELMFFKVLDLFHSQNILDKHLANFTHDSFGLLQHAIIAGSEPIFLKVLELLQTHEHLDQHLTQLNAHGYSCLFQALYHSADDGVNTLLSIMQTRLSKKEWHQLLCVKKASRSPMHAALTSTRPSLTKVKLLIAAYARLGIDVPQYLALSIDLDTPLVIKGVRYEWRTLIAENLSFTLPPVAQVLADLLAKRISLDTLLQTRDFSMTELTMRHQHKSILWFAACQSTFNQPQPFLTIWQTHQSHFTLKDLSDRSTASISAHKSVFWFILYQAGYQAEYAEIIQVLWSRFPALFELDYCPKGEPPTRSVKALLQRLKETGEDILYALGEPMNEVGFSAPELQAALLEPTAGIGDKYLGGALPSLFSAQPALTALSEYPASCTLQHCPTTLSHVSVRSHAIDSSELQATFYSARPLVDLAKGPVTFICAGRTHHALVPPPHQGRLIWVLTEPEYHGLKPHLLPHHEALVLKEMDTSISGRFDSLERLTARRLGIFLFAHHMSLPHFIMMDDNIEKVQSQTPNWQGLYQQLQAELKDHACVSVRTLSHKTDRQGELGSKLFMINFAKIQAALPDIRHIPLLLPPARAAHQWGEDYYFQIMLHQLFPQQGYRIVEKSHMTLTRAKAHAHAFIRAQAQTGTLIAQPYDLPTAPALTLQQLDWLTQTVTTLNQIIADNLKRYQTKRHALERANLLAQHASLNHNQAATLLPAQKSMSFKALLDEVQFTEGGHYPHQIAALKSVTQAQHADIIMATGTGKTRVQCELARLKYQTMTPGTPLIIVTPQKSLVNQFYEDFCRFAQTQTADIDLTIPTAAIMKIASGPGAMSVERLLQNKTIHRQRSILIFCEKSFQKYLTELKNKTHGLILCDEYHAYPATVAKLLEQCPALTVLGLTATPPLQPLFKTAFTYSVNQALQDKRIAPFIMDTFNTPYTPEAVTTLIESLPALLQSRYHPGSADRSSGAKRLSELKGIIYFPNHQACEQAYQCLKAQGFDSYLIDSHHADSVQHLAHFKAAHSGILIANQMLRIGFDDSALSWVVIAQNANACTLVQQVGRVLRLNHDKIGYIITFDDIAQRIRTQLPIKQSPVCEAAFSNQPMPALKVKQKDKTQARPRNRGYFNQHRPYRSQTHSQPPILGKRAARRNNDEEQFFIPKKNQNPKSAKRSKTHHY